MAPLIRDTMKYFKLGEKQSKQSWNSPDAEADVSLLRNGDTEVPASVFETATRLRKRTPWPWILSTLIFAIISIVLVIKPLHSGCSDSYESGFHTDLKASRAEVKLKRVRFNGSLAYDSNGTLIRQHVDGEPNWVGEPSPEMDALWDRLESAAGVYLEGDEAEMSRGHTRLYNGYWVTGLDVFHQVHCLNMIRKALSPEYYHMSGESKKVHNIHVDHCLDYVRQGILCSADMTPVNVLWYPSADMYAPNFNTYHTCRDVDLLTDWSLQRSKRGKKGGEEGESARVHDYDDE